MVNFNEKICSNYIINKSNSIFPYNSDHCLIAADFDTIELIGWLPGEGMENTEVVKYDMEEILINKEEISEKYEKDNGIGRELVVNFLQIMEENLKLPGSLT